MILFFDASKVSKMSLKTIAILIFLGFVLPAFPQETTKPSPPAAAPGSWEQNVIYRNEMTGGILAHTNGFGLNYRRTKHANGYRRGILEFEMVNMKHTKEVKTVNPYFENSKGFFYGKMNTFHVFRPGIGVQNVLFRRAERKSIEIRYTYILGGSVGFAKPVYLEILKSTSNPYEYDLSTERYDPVKHDLTDIYGRAPFFKGVDEVKIIPGGYARFGLSFEFGELKTSINAIETGVTVDVFAKSVPIMAEAKNNQVFVNLYISYIFGKRWY